MIRKWEYSQLNRFLFSLNLALCIFLVVNIMDVKPLFDRDPHVTSGTEKIKAIVWKNYSSIGENLTETNDTNNNHQDNKFFLHGVNSTATDVVTPVKDLGWKRPSVVYGHVHMAKTAGTEINGVLASHFERVCGHKGYSYDAFQNQERVKVFKRDFPQAKATSAKLDSFSDFRKGFNRGRVPWDVMEEIGFEDCDYISTEDNATFWRSLSARWKMELHVPCREPLNHFMSMCNQAKQIFECDKSADDQGLEAEIDKCVIYMYRFDDYFRNDPNITLKCFDPVPVSNYISYMGKILQRKRIESDYIHRDTNAARNEDEECIWKMDKDFKDRVWAVLKKKYSFFRFCGECIYSPDELKFD